MDMGMSSEKAINDRNKTKAILMLKNISMYILNMNKCIHM